MFDIDGFIKDASAIGIRVINFDSFDCEACGKDSGDWEGGVEPNANHSYCSECWPKHKHLYEED
jgi:hypothetical protein